MRPILLVPAAALALAAACTSSPGEGKPRAEVADVPATPAAAAPAEVAAAEALPVPALSAATTLEVDRAASKLGVIGAKITAKHPIVFHEFTGRVGLDGDAVTAVAFAAKVASLESDAPKLTEHLKAADFLDVATYPHATFASTQVTPGASVEGATHTVTGDLSIRGTTKRVTFPATITVAEGSVTAATEFVINRKDFDVVYPGRPDDLVQDDVLMQVSLVAPRS